jgi:pimeloyl-ACP methyl ester carboxylesterase
MKELKLDFKSSDGIKLEGVLTTPQTNFNKCIILVHGITSNYDEWGFYKDAADFFASKNIASFRFNYRYHYCNTENISLEKLTLCGIINDIDAAANLLRNHDYTKKSDLYILGTSFGGGVSMYWANHFDSKISKIFLVAPVLNYEDDILNRENYLDENKILIKKEQESLSNDGFISSDGIKFGRSIINEIPIIDKELDTKIETIIFHGNKDSNVPYDSSLEYASNSSLCSLITIENADHGFAVEGDEDLTAYGTKENHKSVYRQITDNIL